LRAEGGREGGKEEETGCECPMCKLGESETDDRQKARSRERKRESRTRRREEEWACKYLHMTNNRATDRQKRQKGPTITTKQTTLVKVNERTKATNQ